METCKYSFRIDGDGNPTIEAETKECKAAALEALKGKELQVMVKVPAEDDVEADVLTGDADLPP